MDKKDKRKKILRISELIGLFLLVFGLSYALFTVTLNGTKKVKVKTGKLELQLLDENNNDITDSNNAGYSINLDDQVPVDDETGLGTQAFEFKLKNNGTISARYTIYLDDVELEEGEDRIADEYIRYSLTKNGSEDNPQDLTSIGANPNRKLDEGVIKKDVINTYTLRIWIDEEATNEAMDKVFSATLRVYGVQYVQTGPFEDGTMAAALYEKGTVGEYNAITAKVPNGFNSETEDDGLYKYTDSERTVTYAYRGIDVDNYVTFAEQTWRILRIQSDGSIKLIKEDLLNFESDKVVHSNSGYKSVRYNNLYSNYDYNKYKNSNIEAYVNEWYTSEMSTYASKLADNDYCSDRYEPAEPSPLKTALLSDWAHVYGIYNRTTFTNVEDFSTFSFAPSLTCVTSDKVNAKAALITADEYIISGGGIGEVNNYLRKSNSYWTMSPASFFGGARSFGVYGDGSIDESDVNFARGVRPVITLKASATISSGEGTSQSPYVIG